MPQTSKIPYYHLLNQWLLGKTNGKPRTNSDEHLEVLRLSDTHKGYNTSKYALNLKFPIIIN